MQMRPGDPAGRADQADLVTLADMLSGNHLDLRQMHQRADQAHAMIDQDEIAFEGERMIGGQHDDPVGGTPGRRAIEHRTVGIAGDIDPAMIAAGNAGIDALRSEQGADPAFRGPDEFQRIRSAEVAQINAAERIR